MAILLVTQLGAQHGVSTAYDTACDTCACGNTTRVIAIFQGGSLYSRKPCNGQMTHIWRLQKASKSGPVSALPSYDTVLQPACEVTAC
jgi:hypothetical protein